MSAHINDTNGLIAMAVISALVASKKTGEAKTKKERAKYGEQFGAAIDAVGYNTYADVLWNAGQWAEYLASSKKPVAAPKAPKQASKRKPGRVVH